MIQPVYPKDDPGYRKRVMEKFYKQVKDTKWEEPEDKICKKKSSNFLCRKLRRKP